jgi:hypothetical protein
LGLASPRTTAQTLAKMRKEGSIDNQCDHRGNSYGLPIWSQDSLDVIERCRDGSYFCPLT